MWTSQAETLSLESPYQLMAPPFLSGNLGAHPDFRSLQH